MYQLHYTLDPNQISYQQAFIALDSSHKLIQHYNISNGIQFYELLTSKNFTDFPTISSLNLPTLRVKLETTLPTKDFLYIEKHFKLTYAPALPKNKYTMLTKVINSTTHSFIVTVRATSIQDLQILEDSLNINPIKTTTEYCIFDTNENLDYLHT